MQGRMGLVVCQASNTASCMTLHKFVNHTGLGTILASVSSFVKWDNNRKYSLL